jgi:hypothetical protein
VPWAPAGAASAATASSLLYGAAPACPLPINALYKSPLQHVTLSVKVSSQRLSLARSLVHCCVVGSMPLPGTPLPSAQAYMCTALQRNGMRANSALMCCHAHRRYLVSSPLQQPPTFNPWLRVMSGLVRASWKAPTGSPMTPSTPSCTWSASQAASSCS